MGRKTVDFPALEPGRKTKLTRIQTGVVLFLLLLTGGVFCFALYMAAVHRVTEIQLDPYADLTIEGADGYGRALASFDEERFCKDLAEKMLSLRSSLTEEEIRALAESAARAPVCRYSVEKADGGEDDSWDSRLQEENRDQERGPHPANLSNGDTVTLVLSISEDVQNLLKEKGFSLAFDCVPVTVRVQGLPNVVPYDPFEDLNVRFSGFDGSGRITVEYQGQYPLSFSCRQDKALRNGDSVLVVGELSQDYDMSSFIEEFHIAPSSLEKEYMVSGLLINPTSIRDFTADNLKEISDQARTAALLLIQEEYGDGEEILRLENAAMYYAFAKTGPDAGAEEGEETGEETGEDAGEGTGEEESGSGEEAEGEDSGSGEETKNFLLCAYAVGYADSAGREMDYYYYIRYDDLVLDEEGSLIADFTKVKHPEKSTNPIERLFGEGDDVALPGMFNFGVLAGFRTLDDLYENALAPMESEYEISSLIQP